MNAPFTSGKFLCRIALVVAVAILVPISPHEASAKGGIKSNTFNPFSRAEAATITSSPAVPQATTPNFGGCGGKRYRDPHSHQCRGPSDFGN